MSGQIPAVQLSRLSKKLETHLGLYFPPDRHADLAKRLVPIADEFGFGDAAACVDWLLNTTISPREWAVLTKHLTIGETYFFREPAAFNALRDQILPEMLAASNRHSRRLRIWSAAASTGEEAYSLAMMLDRLLPKYPGWTASIFATDVNADALEKAQRGIFRRWSFRGISQAYRREYFSELSDGTFQISPRIRQMVSFFPFNLVTDNYPSYLKQLHDVDIIFCRNVLIYFSAETVATVTEKLMQTLASDGWLVVSPSEVPHITADELQRHIFGGVTFFQKRALSIVKTELALPAILPTHSAPVQKALSPTEMYNRALNFYRQGEYVAAAEILEEMLTASDGALANQPDAVQLLIHTYANRQQLTEAEAWCRRAIAANKLNPRYHYLLATIFEAQKDDTAAIAALKKTLFLKHNFALAHFTLGSILQQQGKLTDARRHFRTLKEILATLPPNAILIGSDDLTVAGLRQMTTHLE